MWNYVKNFFIAFCSESSVHGIKYLIKDKNIVSRCYWCVVLIFTLYCCGQFTVLLSNRFLEIPIRMTIKTNQALTEELPLPHITFCSEKPSDVWYKRFLDDLPDTFVSAGNVFSNNLKVVITTDYGEAYTMIHRPGSELFTDQGSHIMSNGYYIMYYIDPVKILRSEEVHEIHRKAGTCVHPDEQVLRYFNNYDTFNCAIELLINQSIALCGCAAPYTPVPDEYTCNFTELNCVRAYPVLNKKPATILSLMKELPASNGVEFHDCPDACTYIYYKRTFTPRVLVPQYDCTGFLTDVDPKTQYVMHFTYASQFYRMDEFVLITDWITLLSNLGGVYGLFLGCSMLTIVELIYYLWSRLISKLWSADHAPSYQRPR